MDRTDGTGDYGTEAPFNNLKATLQFNEIGLGQKQSVKILVSANAQIKPSTIAIVFALDISMSMGSGNDSASRISLAKKTMRQFLNSGLPGTKVFTQFVLFGVDATVPQPYESMPLIELTQDTRPALMKIVDDLDGVDGGTNISAAVEKAVELANIYQKLPMDTAMKAPVQHVIVLTDGAANNGICCQYKFAKFTTDSIGTDNTFVHYIGLGEGVVASFMQKATDFGKTGVFALAPNAAAIDEAYEKIFGYVMDTAEAFDVVIYDANGARIERLGMLTREREALIDVQIPSAIEEKSKACVVRVANAKNNKAVGTEICCFVNYKEGVDGCAGEHPDVKAKIEEAIVDRERDLIMHEAPDLGTALKRLNEADASYERRGFSSKAVSKAKRAMKTVQDADDDLAYRSLSGVAAAGLLGVEMSSQQDY
jgi:hypothetical protein